MYKSFIFFGLFFVVVAAVIYYSYHQPKEIIRDQDVSLLSTTSPPITQNTELAPTERVPALSGWPLPDALKRITKKLFGIKISPENSPVQPERFSGYHTGVDFETFFDEQNKDVPVYAICDGALLMKKWASGYGGVVVQGCVIDNQDVTVIYGHVRLASVAVSVGQEVIAGEKIAALGNAYSNETDHERKHLHLGIHKGAAINIKGYVSTQNDLQDWIDINRVVGGHSL